MLYDSLDSLYVVRVIEKGAKPKYYRLIGPILCSWLPYWETVDYLIIMLRESILYLKFLRLSQSRFQLALNLVKLNDRLCRLEQQIIFISSCIHLNVFPNTIHYLHLPMDYKAQLSIKNKIIRKLLRKLYGLRAHNQIELEKVTSTAQNVLRPPLFSKIQNICIMGTQNNLQSRKTD